MRHTFEIVTVIAVLAAVIGWHQEFALAAACAATGGRVLLFAPSSHGPRRWHAIAFGFVAIAFALFFLAQLLLN